MAEPIRNDYGEDLLVQSHLAGSADNFRLLIQVKGTSSKTHAEGSQNIRLKVDHLLRWINQSDPVLVCVYNDITDKIHAFSPNKRFSLWELSTTRKKSISVKLSKGDEFDEKSAGGFIWRCRIEHWSRMFSWYENHINYHGLGGGSLSRRKKIQLNGNVIILTFLKAVGIIEDDAVSREFRKKVLNCSANFGKRNESEGTNLDMSCVFTLALLGQVHEVCGEGLPGNLLVHGENMCSLFLKQCHRKEWLAAERRLKLKFSLETPPALPSTIRTRDD